MNNNISYKRKLNGLKATNWANKSDKQKQDILLESYKTIGRKAPAKLIQGDMTNSQFNNYLNTVTNNLDILATKQQLEKNRNIKKLYETTREELNKGIKQKIKSLKLSEVEERYLKGEAISNPNVRNADYYSDNVVLREVTENRKISTNDRRKEVILEMKKQLQKVNSIKTTNKLYNTRSNNRAFKDLLESNLLTGAEEGEVSVLENMYKELTDFEKEVFIKTSLNHLRQVYEDYVELNGGMDEELSANLLNRLSDDAERIKRWIRENKL